MWKLGKRWSLRPAGSAIGAALAFAGLSAQAANFNVADTDQLRQAIIDVNASPSPSSPHTITFTSNITLNTVLTPIASDVDILGGSFTISGDDRFQVFFVDSGSVSIQNLTIQNGLSQGGNGGLSRAGGGLGAGGALFVNTGAVVAVTDVFFRSNTARGGNGGAGGAGPGNNVGGGGGGFHGDGGDFGGGGGGYNGGGGTDGGGGGGLEGNGFSDPANGGGKFANDVGGRVNPVEGGTGGAGGEFEGGGFGTRGGAGGRFGGGGGSTTIGGGVGGDFGGGGGSVDLDDSEPVTGSGGQGGFGGGGGGSSNGTPSSGGFGGGDGAASGLGGAGSSLGGAIFVRTGGELTFVLSAGGDVTSSNSVVQALGSGQPEVAGSDLYLMNGVTSQIDVATSTTSTFRGSLSGEGGLTKSGAGTLVLTGNNDFSGNTTITSGVLQGTTGSLPGDIVVQAGAIVRFEQDSSGSYANVLSGAGNFEKNGTGTVTLAGSNTYTGTTTIAAGTLSVTTGTLPGTTSTSVSAGATLRFDQSSDGTYAAPINGAGQLDKAGSGRVTLDADYSGWTGVATVRNGELSLASAATLGSTTIDVESGGRLGGTGAGTGDVTVTGTLAPGTGSTPGSLTIGGNLTLANGAELEIDVTDAAGVADRVDVGGSATFASGSGVTVLPAAGNYTSPLMYDILTASGGIVGIPGVTDDFCFFRTQLNVIGNTLELTLTPDLQLDGSCSNTQNQRAVGSALVQGNVIDDPALQAAKDALNVLTQSQVPQALDEMGGEGLAGFGHARLAAATQFLGSLSQRMRDPGSDSADAGVPYPLSMGGPLLPSLGVHAALQGPLDAARISAGLGASGAMAAAPRRGASPFTFSSQRGDSGVGGWLDGFATFASVDGNGGNSGSAGGTGKLPKGTHDTDFNLYGTAGGVDWAFGDGAMLGAAFGYTRSKLSVSDLTTWGTGDTFQGALYGTFATDDFYLGGVARYAYTTMDTTRRISFGGLYEKANGDFDGSSISGYAEAGLAAVEWQAWWFQPSTSFQYTYMDTEEFTESGAPGLNLNVDSESFSSIVSNLGLRVYRPFRMDDRTEIVPELRVRWAHEFGDLDRNVPARFDDVTTGAAAFEVQGAKIGRDVAVVGAGWTVIGEGNINLSLNYDATLNEDLIAHTATLGLLIYW